MRIAELIRFMMMNPVDGYPENRAAFERQSSADCEEVFEPLWHLVGPVRVQPVIAQADAKTGGHPVQTKRHSETGPTKHEQRGNRADMQDHQDNDGNPVQSVRI